MDILLLKIIVILPKNIADYCEFVHELVPLAMDGQSFLRMMERQQFDVVVLDVMLPRMDGLTCLWQCAPRATPPRSCC